jgi:hypothetical protein
MCGDFLRPLAPLQHPGDMALNTFCPISFTRAALPDHHLSNRLFPEDPHIRPAETTTASEEAVAH